MNDTQQHDYWVAQVNESIPHWLAVGNSLAGIAQAYLNDAAEFALNGHAYNAKRAAVQGSHLFFLVRSSK